MPYELPAQEVLTIAGVGTVNLCRRTTAAPLLIYFATDAATSLTAGALPTLMHEKGWAVATLDLPGHGGAIRPEETASGLTLWARRAGQGENFVQSLCDRVRVLIDTYIIPQGISASGRIAVGGHSRGGFMAMHALAQLSKVAAGVAFIPVTRLSALSEFTAEGVPADNHVVIATEIRNLPLEGKKLFVAMGLNDTRVSAAKCSESIGAIVGRSGNSNALEYHLCPAADHTIPAGMETKAADWAFAKVT